MFTLLWNTKSESLIFSKPRQSNQNNLIIEMLHPSVVRVTKAKTHRCICRFVSVINSYLCFRALTPFGRLPMPLHCPQSTVMPLMLLAPSLSLSHTKMKFFKNDRSWRVLSVTFLNMLLINTSKWINRHKHFSDPYRIIMFLCPSNHTFHSLLSFFCLMLWYYLYAHPVLVMRHPMTNN